MYYSPNKILNKKCIFNFVLGARGYGKTYSSKKTGIIDYLENQNEFVYVRRYKDELALSMNTFFKDLKKDKYFNQLSLSTGKVNKLDCFKVNDEVMGYGIALSTSSIMKSVSFPNVKLIIFDEFLIDKGNYRYLQSEVIKFLELYETIARDREDVQVLFLGNSISSVNPYFLYFDLDVENQTTEFKRYKEGTICVQLADSKEFSEHKNYTQFGKLIEGTPYGNYAINNQFLRDNLDFIEDRGNRCRFWSAIQFEDEKFGIWYKADNDHFVISEKFDPSTKIIYAISIDSHNPDSYYIDIRKNPLISLIINNYKSGKLGFENQKIKTLFMKFIKRCISY